MKKLISMAIVLVMVVALFATMVNAATNDTLADEIYSMGAKYGMTEADKVKIERYLSDYPVTDDQANQVIAYANEAVKIMENAGVTDYRELSREDKDALKTIANNAASVLGVTLTFKAGTVEVYKDGKLIETITSSTSGKLAYTGNNINTVLVVSSVAVVALAAAVVVGKKFANA